MRNIAAIITAILMLGISLRYCWLTITGEADPVFAGWLVLTVSVGLSFWTYCKTKKRNLIDNIGNTIDMINVLLIISAISIFGQNMRSGFTWFEIGNLIAAGAITIFWWKSKNPFASNIAVQILMLIGYIPIIARVATANENPEPWSVWIPIWFACIFATITAFLPKCNKDNKSKNWKDTILPKIYASRATFSVTILLILMLRLELK